MAWYFGYYSRFKNNLLEKIIHEAACLELHTFKFDRLYTIQNKII